MWRLLTRLVARPQPEVQSEALATWLPRTGIPVQTWESGHFAALHVRRTDKKIETRRSSSCLYLGKLSHLAYKTGLTGADALYIFVATDDPAVLRELRRCPPPPEVKKPQAYRFVSLVEGWRAPWHASDESADFWVCDGDRECSDAIDCYVAILG